MSDDELQEYARQLYLMKLLTGGAIDAAMQAAPIGVGSRGLDAGCGIGADTFELAARVGPDGEVVGLDIAAGMLAYAKKEAARRGGSLGVSFREGSIAELPFDDASFDWIWCRDTLWPGFIGVDPRPRAQELARVVKPGGAVCLVYWGLESILCGEPIVQARLQAAMTAATFYFAGEARNQVMRGREWLADAGLERPTAQTFVAEVRGPLDADRQEALGQCFSMLWDKPSKDLAAADRETFERCCRPDSDGFVGRLPGYYGYITYTLFCGVVP